MKEHIYTIPINDAFDTDCECPVCAFLKSEEAKLIDYTLGASMMEPDERIITNQNGFCKHHFSMLLGRENKLSMALILETHLAELRKIIDKDAKDMTSHKKPLFKKSPVVSQVIDKYNSITDSCVICSKLNSTTDKFIDNLFSLYKKEDEFKEKFNNSKGFCIPHFSLLVSAAANVLSGNVLTEFYDKIYEIETNHLARVQEDITWFTKKFDFRYANEDWKTSRDAVPRTTEKIIGYITPVKETK